jgi:hypothetical protein
MKRILFLLALVALIVTFNACGAVNQLNPLTGNDNFKKAGALWNDVPAMDGLGSPIDAELPASIKLFMRTGVNLMMKGMGEGAPEWDWLMFTTTKTSDDIADFYTIARMAAPPYNWANDASGCMSGQQVIAQGGVFCAFTKQQGDKQIGLLIITAQDDKTKQTSVFFLRGESAATPIAQNAPTASANQKSSKGAITMLNGTAPYGIEKRPMPNGLNLDQLLPKQVGPYTRASVERASNQGVPATSVDVDGDSIYARYRSGGKEIFVEFAVASSASDAQSTLDVAATEVTNEFPTDPRFGSIGTEPSYLKVIDENGAFIAWTRGGYYFSASAKSEADLDAFMQAFPY